jgi:hypothetical protein
MHYCYYNSSSPHITSIKINSIILSLLLKKNQYFDFIKITLRNLNFISIIYYYFKQDIEIKI